jgi:heterodisulfide reductase subunit B
MEAALFLGCNVPVRRFEYEAAARKVAKAFDIQFWDSNDFGCCGYPAGPTEHDTFLALAARNICIAEEKGLDLITLCNACTGSLAKVNHLLKENEEERNNINKILKESIGREFKGTSEVYHFTRYLYEKVGLDRIKEKITNPFSNVKIAIHEGCHYLKPPAYFDDFDDPHRPFTTRQILEATGVTVIDYENRKNCCGGAIIAVDEETAVKMVKEKLININAAGAEMLAVQCPYCNVMYGEYQKDERMNLEFKLPLVFLPQILGLAMGFDGKKDLGMKKKVIKLFLEPEEETEKKLPATPEVSPENAGETVEVTVEKAPEVSEPAPAEVTSDSVEPQPEQEPQPEPSPDNAEQPTRTPEETNKDEPVGEN